MNRTKSFCCNYFSKKSITNDKFIYHPTYAFPSVNGHLNPNPICFDFVGVCSCDSVCIVFTYADLNGLDMYTADIKSAYLQAPTSEKHLIRFGEEFPIEMNVRSDLIQRAL